MKRFLCLTALLLAAISVATDYPTAVKKQLYATNDLRGKKAPEMTGVTWLTAAPVTQNKILVIDFWATWCPPCRETIPELGDWQKKFSKDITVIGISDEAANVVNGFMKTTPMPYSVGVDAAKRMNKIVGVQGIPHILVITPDHIVRWQGFPLQGEDTLTEAKLKQIIDAWKSGVR